MKRNLAGDEDKSNEEALHPNYAPQWVSLMVPHANDEIFFSLSFYFLQCRQMDLRRYDYFKKCIFYFLLVILRRGSWEPFVCLCGTELDLGAPLRCPLSFSHADSVVSGEASAESDVRGGNGLDYLSFSSHVTRYFTGSDREMWGSSLFFIQCHLQIVSRRTGMGFEVEFLEVGLGLTPVWPQVQFLKREVS